MILEEVLFFWKVFFHNMIIDHVIIDHPIPGWLEIFAVDVHRLHLLIAIMINIHQYILGLNDCSDFA